MSSIKINSALVNKNILKKCGISLSSSSEGKKKYIIKWPDNTFRWIFSIRKFSNGYLAFLNKVTFRQTIYNIIIFFLAKISTIFSNKIIHIKSFNLDRGGLLWKVMRDLDADDWDIFGGTPGIFRNIVISILKDENIIGYLKIPTNNKEIICNFYADSFLNEPDAYDYILDLNLKNVLIPKIERVAESSFFMKNIEARHPLERDIKLVLNGLVELKNNSQTSTTVGQYLHEKKLITKIKQIEVTKPKDFLFKKSYLNDACLSIRKKIESLERTRRISTCFAIMDFTPWNAFIYKNKLCLIDVEHSQRNISLGYDVIHFYVQDFLMHERKCTHKKLRSILVNKLIPILNEDLYIPLSEAKLYVDLFLMQKIIMSLDLYSNQLNLHRQAIMQLKFWQNVDSLWVGDS